MSDESRRAFVNEADTCRCIVCQKIVEAIFSVWLETEVRDILMGGFVLHASICYRHRYQAHQQG